MGENVSQGEIPPRGQEQTDQLTHTHTHCWATEGAQNAPPREAEALTSDRWTDRQKCSRKPQTRQTGHGETTGDRGRQWLKVWPTWGHAPCPAQREGCSALRDRCPRHSHPHPASQPHCLTEDSCHPTHLGKEACSWHPAPMKGQHPSPCPSTPPGPTKHGMLGPPIRSHQRSGLQVGARPREKVGLGERGRREPGRGFPGPAPWGTMVPTPADAGARGGDSSRCGWDGGGPGAGGRPDSFSLSPSRRTFLGRRGSEPHGLPGGGRASTSVCPSPRATHRPPSFLSLPLSLSPISLLPPSLQEGHSQPGGNALLDGSPRDPGGLTFLRSVAHSPAPRPPGIGTALGPPLASIPGVASGSSRASLSPGGESSQDGPLFWPFSHHSLLRVLLPQTPLTPFKGKLAVTPFRGGFLPPSSSVPISNYYLVILQGIKWGRRWSREV